MKVPGDEEHHVEATVIRTSIDLPSGAVPTITIPSAVGVMLILVGITLFIVDLSVTNHGLLIAGGIVTLLAGGLALFVAGVPYSGLLLGALVVVAMLMGGVLFGILGSLRLTGRRRLLRARRG